MQTKIYITMECEKCDETMKNSLVIFHDDNEVPEISWDQASCSSFTCESCGAGHHTGDFEYLNDDEI